ncbi:MAG: rhodanese-like domain-containing protein [Thermodesulfobacteriota bacterium]
MDKKRTWFALKQAFWQIILLTTAACVLALGVNALRPDGIPLAGSWSAEARLADAGEEGLAIDLAGARQLFKAGRVLFVDARSIDQYIEGHIQGALPLPWLEVDRYLSRVNRQLETAEAIITYCDGTGCDLSHELAGFLRSMGLKNVRVLINGWTLWQQAGLPTKTGA